MDFRALYQKELDHLLVAGQSFSKVHSQARHLAQRSGDPDVERLLEGFAFLSAKVRARIDAGVPQIIHSLTELLAPAQLRPIPSCTMLEFTKDPNQGRDAVTLPAHTQVRSETVQEMSLRFRTTRSLTILPMVIERTQIQASSDRLCKLSVTFRGATTLPKQIADLGYVDFYVHGGCEQASSLYHALVSQCRRIEIHGEDENFVINNPRFIALGVDQGAPLLPWPQQAWQGQQRLAEYFTLPEKFRQFRICELAPLAKLKPSSTLKFVFHLEKDITSIGPLVHDPLRIHCTPAINLFECDGEPITQNCLSAPQGIRAAGHRLDQFELYDLSSVTRTQVGQNRRETLANIFSSFTPPSGSGYLVERRPSQLDQHSDCYLRVIDPNSHDSTQRELISMELRCSNRHLPALLRLGQINRLDQPAPAQIAVRDLRVPTQSSPAPLHEELQWQLLSLICAARCAYPSKEQLRSIMWSYNHQARLHSAQGQANQQLSDAIRSVESHAYTGFVQGSPTRGRACTIELKEQDLSEGQAFIFGQVLHELLSDTVALNTLHRTHLRLHPSGRSFTWCPHNAATRKYDEGP